MSFYIHHTFFELSATPSSASPVAALPAFRRPPLGRRAHGGTGLAHQRRHADGAQADVGGRGRVVADALRRVGSAMAKERESQKKKEVISL